MYVISAERMFLLKYPERLTVFLESFITVDGVEKYLLRLTVEPVGLAVDLLRFQGVSSLGISSDTSKPYS